MSATLTVEPYPLLAGASRIVIDCRHGETTLLYVLPPGGPVVVSERDLARLALARHYSEERCRCTRKLRRRLGVEGTA